MSDIWHIRNAVIALIAFAGVEDEMLLGSAGESGPDEGSPQRWAARPLVAHNTEFKRQQVLRLEVIRDHKTPPPFPEIDHGSEEVYRGYSEQPLETVREDSRRTTKALIDEVGAASDEDLLDPSRNPWLDGRHLWLQVVVRGFWHPTGHLGEYYLVHGKTGAALSTQARACALATCLSAPDAARGMALYNLACAQARADMAAEAAETLREAIALNAQLQANARRDTDLAVLRNDGWLDALLASR